MHIHIHARVESRTITIDIDKNVFTDMLSLRRIINEIIKELEEHCITYQRIVIEIEKNW